MFDLLIRDCIFLNISNAMLIFIIMLETRSWKTAEMSVYFV